MMGIGREAFQRETSIQHEAGQQISAARALGEDLDELEALAAQLLTVRNRVRIKARALHTSREVGDAQTSEAELVAAPLRQRIADLESELAIADPPPAECLTVQKLSRQLDVALSQVSALQRRKEELHGRVANLVEWLDLRNGELASANEQRDQARAEVERLEALLASRDTSVAELRALITGHQRDLDALADTLKGREKQIQDGRAAQQVTRQELDKKRAQLTTMTADRDAQQGAKNDAWERLGTIERIVREPAVDDALNTHAIPSCLTLADAIKEIRETLKGFS